jgi:UDP-N-acetylglucosamine--N-acetylmuramyl-(pentapeptide) pyrophosphoryl-undecaprenol N-acetylglucosamine transferase
MAMSGDRGAPIAIVIAGGGTGGHLYPGIAVARELIRQRPATRVSFAGTARGLEARVLPREGFSLDLIRSAGLKGKSVVLRLRGAALLAPAMWDAWSLLSRRRPHVVIGVGGYSSGPVVMLAALRGIPTLVLEQNAVPGLTNRLLSRVVRAAAVTYEETLPFFGRRGFVSGNPVRAEFFSRTPRDTGTGRRLLVLGGSQGAHAINVGVMQAAGALRRTVHELSVVHQTGERDLAPTREAYRAVGMDARVEPFLDGVAAEMAAATLVVCRAGATTLAELAAVGRPAVIIPLPTATDDHQRRNARVLADAGAAVMVEESELGGSRLANVIAELVADGPRLAAMADAMGRFAKPDAAARIASRVWELAA